MNFAKPKALPPCTRKDIFGVCLPTRESFTPHTRHSIHPVHRKERSVAPRPAQPSSSQKKGKKEDYEPEADGTDPDPFESERVKLRIAQQREQPTLENFTSQMMDEKHLILAADIIQGDGAPTDRSLSERTVLAQEHLNRYTNGRMVIEPTLSSHEHGILVAKHSNGKRYAAQPGSRLTASKGTIQDWAHNAVAYDLPQYIRSEAGNRLGLNNEPKGEIHKQLHKAVNKLLDKAVKKSHEGYADRRRAKYEHARDKGLFDSSSENFVDVFTGSSKGANDSVNIVHDAHKDGAFSTQEMAEADRIAGDGETKLSVPEEIALRKPEVRAYNMMTTQDIFNKDGAFNTVAHPEKANVNVHVIRNQGDVATAFFGLRKAKTIYEKGKNLLSRAKNPRNALDMLRDPISEMNNLFGEDLNLKIDTVKTMNAGPIERHLNIPDRIGLREASKEHFYRGRLLREQEIHDAMIKSVKRGDTFTDFMNSAVMDDMSTPQSQEFGMALESRSTPLNPDNIGFISQLYEETHKHVSKTKKATLDDATRKYNERADALRKLGLEPASADDLVQQGELDIVGEPSVTPDTVENMMNLQEQRRQNNRSRRRYDSIFVESDTQSPFTPAEIERIRAADPRAVGALRQDYLNPNVNEELKNVHRLRSGTQTEQRSTMYGMRDPEQRRTFAQDRTDLERRDQITGHFEDLKQSGLALDSARSARAQPKTLGRNVYEHIGNAFSPTEIVSGFIAGKAAESVTDKILGKARSDLGQGDFSARDLGEISGRSAFAGAASAPVGKSIMMGLGAAKSGVKRIAGRGAAEAVAEEAAEAGAGSLLSGGAKTFVTGLGAEAGGAAVGMAVGSAATYGIEKGLEAAGTSRDTAMGVGETTGGAIGGVSTVLAGAATSDLLGMIGADTLAGAAGLSELGPAGIIAGGVVGAAFGLGGYLYGKYKKKKQKRLFKKYNEDTKAWTRDYQSSGFQLGTVYSTPSSLASNTYYQRLIADRPELARSSVDNAPAQSYSAGIDDEGRRTETIQYGGSSTKITYNPTPADDRNVFEKAIDYLNPFHH